MSDYTKIQPEQIQLPTFFSESGDLLFSDLTTGFKIELNRNLTGDFNINGGLTVNDNSFALIDSSITYNIDNGGMLLGGKNNTVSGQFNILTMGSGNNMFGSSNAIFNASDSTINSGADFNTLLAGNTIDFSSGVTGSAYIGDDTSAFNVNQSKKFIINFASGQRFLTETLFEDNVDVTGDLMISGNRVARFLDITGISGANTIIENDGTTTMGTGLIVLNLGGKKIRVIAEYI